MTAKEETPAIFLEDGLADLERDLASVYAAISNTAQAICRLLPFLLGMTQTLNSFGDYSGLIRELEAEIAIG